MITVDRNTLDLTVETAYICPISVLYERPASRVDHEVKCETVHVIRCRTQSVKDSR